MTTSYRLTVSFSSSYSMLTSQVPSLDGVGQQLTGDEEVSIKPQGVHKTLLLDSGTYVSSLPAYRHLSTARG